MPSPTESGGASPSPTAVNCIPESGDDGVKHVRQGTPGAQGRRLHRSRSENGGNADKGVVCLVQVKVLFGAYIADEVIAELLDKFLFPIAVEFAGLKSAAEGSRPVAGVDAAGIVPLDIRSGSDGLLPSAGDLFHGLFGEVLLLFGEFVP